MDEVFKALADPSRRRLLDSLNGHNGQTLTELCSTLDMARQSVSKHLAVLEAAHLVVTQRRGREKLHYLNAEPINTVAERWINRYHREHVQALADLKEALEAIPVSDTEFLSVTSINTSPERLWQALTDPAFTARYWGVNFDTDWKPGSTMVWEQSGIRTVDPEQVVLEADPPRRLSYTWHTLTPEFGAAHGFDDEFVDRVGKERRSKVTFEIEPQGSVAKLTVAHNGFDPGSLVLDNVRQGWPALLSNLKTLLETGDTLPQPAARVSDS
ncbi:MAG: metalloregulator ArsR/SmtB family transcription factor [Actinomycetota bacterium]|nr:metalloregulator ArsR/SmtB family transcription factor [Actinomycetota bacterium]